MKYSLLTFVLVSSVEAFTVSISPSQVDFSLRSHDKDVALSSVAQSRKQFLNFALVGASIAVSQPALADGEGGRPESLDIDNFLRTGSFFLLTYTLTTQSFVFSQSCFFFNFW